MQVKLRTLNPQRGLFMREIPLVRNRNETPEAKPKQMNQEAISRSIPMAVRAEAYEMAESLVSAFNRFQLSISTLFLALSVLERFSQKSHIG